MLNYINDTYKGKVFSRFFFFVNRNNTEKEVFQCSIVVRCRSVTQVLFFAEQKMRGRFIECYSVKIYIFVYKILVQNIFV